MAKVGVVKERTPGERRVALVPESVGRLTRGGIEVWVERGAGEGARIADGAYEQAGATLVDGRDALLENMEVLVCVRSPTAAEAAAMPSGLVLIGLLQPGANAEFEAAARDAGLVALALERVPRITRAQSMDVLSSQSTVTGYKSVLIGADAMTKFLPMLTTAAGAIPPAKVFVIGAGVAGLQAIATAKRLGAIVSGFDIRPAAAEQVRSLGATFVAAEALAADAETAGGYAKEQSHDEQERTTRALATHIAEMDLVITTALIPGRPAPRLISEEMVRSMRPGSVIVDLAAESGGNCEATVAGKEVDVGGIKIIGPENLASTLPLHASQMFSRNVLTLLQHLIPDGELQLDREDEIVAPMLLAAPAAAAS
jgi:H+-translocating NAD(P) transhydrogenase subunit alpha